MIYAIVDNNLVIQVREISQEEFDLGIMNKHQNIIDISNILPQPTIGWNFDGQFLSSPVMSKKISKLALRQRMTFNELVAIKTASATNPMVGVLLDNLSVATYIDLSLPQVYQGLGLLVQLNLLTTERMTEILNTPVTYDEIYKGIE